MTTTEAAVTPGLYVIELGPDSVKVGRSGNVDKRLATHLRHARGHGLDPYRYIGVPCPDRLLVRAEREAHLAVQAAGGQPTRSPEVFASVYYNPALVVVQAVVAELVAYEEALAWLSSRTAAALDFVLSDCCDAVKRVVRRAVAEGGAL